MVSLDTPLGAIKRLISSFSVVIPFSGITLFCSLSFTAGTMMSSLREDISKRFKWNDAYVKRFKSHYDLVCQYVEEIDACFGALLLVTLTSTFIRTINNTFFAITSYIQDVERNNSFTAILYTIKDLLTFTLCAYMPHYIRREVFYSKDSLPAHHTLIAFF